FDREKHDGGVPVRAFVDRAKAEALRDELEREARRQTSPFHFLLADLEGLGGAEAFCSALLELGAPAPPPEVLGDELPSEKWAAWWDGVSGDLTDEQREGVWALFKGHHFYEVEPAELDYQELERS